MVSGTQEKSDINKTAKAKSANGRANGQRKNSAASNATSNNETPERKRNGQFRKQRLPETPSWLGAAVSILGIGVAIGGLFATRHQWMPKKDEWQDDYSAAFANDETDYENFDQTRNAGADSMRDHPGDDWEDIDDMSDASFPASDPPSFTPGRA